MERIGCQVLAEEQEGMFVSAPYSSKLWDHFNSPRNAGEMQLPDAVGLASLDGRAPRYTIYLKAAKGRIERATFTVFGCGYSIAACSALTEMITGKTLDQSLAISSDQLIEALGGMPDYKRFCVQLALAAMRDGITKLSSGHINDNNE